MRIKIITVNMRCKENNWVIRDDDQKEIDRFCKEHCVIRTYITPTAMNSMFLLTLEYTLQVKSYCVPSKFFFEGSKTQSLKDLLFGTYF